MSSKEHFNPILPSRHWSRPWVSRQNLSLSYLPARTSPGKLCVCVITGNFESGALCPYSLPQPFIYFTLPFRFPFLSLSRSLPLRPSLSLAFRLYVTGLFSNEHFLRCAPLFLPSRQVSTLYLESHLYHYDISGGQVRTATYQRIC